MSRSAILRFINAGPQSDRYLERVYSFLGDDFRRAPSTIGERLKRHREGAGLTLTVMAKRLGVAQSTLCRWESRAGTGR